MAIRITYEGPAPFARALVQSLEEQGLTVLWEPPLEERGGIIEQVVIPLLVTGAYDAIKVGIRLFSARFPRARVIVEDDDDPPE